MMGTFQSVSFAQKRTIRGVALMRQSGSASPLPWLKQSSVGSPAAGKSSTPWHSVVA